MTVKLVPNQWVKAEIASWWLSLAKHFESLLFFLFLFFLPTQLGKHFWFDFSSVIGQRIDYLSPTLYLTDLLLFLLFIFQIKRLRIPASFLFVVLTLSVGIFFSTSPLLGWYYLAKFLEISFLAWYVGSQRFSELLAGVMLVCGVLYESLLSFVQLFLQHSVGGLLYFLGERAFSAETPGIANASIQGQLFLRPYATFSHPNMFAGFLVVAMLLVLYFLWGKRDLFFRSAVFVSVGFGTIALMLTLSRTAITSWLLVWICLFALLKKSFKTFLIAVFGIVSALFVATLLFPSFLFRFAISPTGQAISERVFLAEEALQMVSSRSLLGVGLGNFIPSLPGLSDNVVYLQPVHNIYLLILAETGLVGFALFCAFLYRLVWRIIVYWKILSPSRTIAFFCLTAALFTILFSGFFDHYFLTLQQGQLLVGLVTGLVLQETTPKRATIQK